VGTGSVPRLLSGKQPDRYQSGQLETIIGLVTVRLAIAPSSKPTRLGNLSASARDFRKVLSCIGATSLRGSPMNMMLIAAILAMSVTPVYAQDQPDIAKLKADAEKLVKMTSGDKQKIKTYCEFTDLSDQIGQANEAQDTKKADELSKKADDLEKKLGPEFVALASELSKLDPNSQDSREIGSILDKLDELCGE
jgi:hypothetical protein